MDPTSRPLHCPRITSIIPSHVCQPSASGLESRRFLIGINLPARAPRVEGVELAIRAKGFGRAMCRNILKSGMPSPYCSPRKSERISRTFCVATNNPRVNTRPLNQQESNNLSCLNRAGKVSALLFLTETGLKKAILDATEPLRKLLLDERVHDYAEQGQGEANKRVLESQIHTESGANPIIASLYRPVTKHGDPRIWFSHFRTHAKPNDVCAVFVHAGEIHLLNLTQSRLASQIAKAARTPLTEFFTALADAATSVAVELLARLRALAAAGPIEGIGSGSTAIGRSVEAALDIPANSSKAPDYHGIEIKSGRSAIQGRENRATLFACVPDWDLSRCKSSRQILDEFGYARGNNFKLYCTVSARAPNSQGLVFEFEDANRWLRETCKRNRERDVAVWRLARLEESLATKHRETFWIKANSLRRRGIECFELVSVVHTRNPNIPQLERMLRDGTVTMDHLIKRKPSGGAAEKGPLFKIVRPRLRELFLGEPLQYRLN